MEYASLYMLIGRYDSKKDVPYLDPDSVFYLVFEFYFNDLTIFGQIKSVHLNVGSQHASLHTLSKSTMECHDCYQRLRKGKRPNSNVYVYLEQQRNPG